MDKFEAIVRNLDRKMMSHTMGIGLVLQLIYKVGEIGYLTREKQRDYWIRKEDQNHSFMTSI